MEIEKCADEVRRGIRDFREYEYCDKFLDAMTANAGDIVAGLAQRDKGLSKARELILQYVYGCCTGLEESEGHEECILYPLVAYTVDGVLKGIAGL